MIVLVHGTPFPALRCIDNWVARILVLSVSLAAIAGLSPIHDLSTTARIVNLIMASDTVWRVNRIEWIN
jgi:hypothetical protein